MIFRNFIRRFTASSLDSRSKEQYTSDRDETSSDGRQSPKLSLCISTYNRGDWLAKSLENWARLYPHPLKHVELFVCDNASTDHTSKVVKPYSERRDFRYICNPENVGMLGNLNKTANAAKGDYIWIVGDDDLIVPSSIERVVSAIDSHPNIALIYINYAYTRVDDARKVKNFKSFFKNATPVVPSEPDLAGPIRTICARNENFFTAIYTLVFRRDHAISAYSQDTSGAPFSTMLTCIPTSYYVLNHMMEEDGLWIGEPQIVVNMNVSWMRYAPLWITERIPELYDVAEAKGVAKADVDRWRRNNLPVFKHYFGEIFKDDPAGNTKYFSARRAIKRIAGLEEFQEYKEELRTVYEQAHRAGHVAATDPVDLVFS